MKRLVALAILVVILTGLLLFGLGNTAISVADTSVPDSKVAAKANKAYDFSASAICKAQGNINHVRREL